MCSRKLGSRGAGSRSHDAVVDSAVYANEYKPKWIENGTHHSTVSLAQLGGGARCTLFSAAEFLDNRASCVVNEPGSLSLQSFQWSRTATLSERNVCPSCG